MSYAKISNLPHLKKLDLSTNQIEELELKGLGELESLSIASNQLVKIDNLPPSIQNLNLSKNKILTITLLGLNKLK